MGNCLMMLGLKSQKRPVTLLLVGLDNAGKTTAAKGILGESLESVAPTLGFVPEVLEYRGCEITIFDLGGGAKLRPVWAKYFAEVHGVVFVIDSSAPQRLEECKQELQRLLAHKKVAGKPVLILANKQDVEGAMDEMDIVESLQVEATVNKYKCPTRVETCSAVTLRNGTKSDKSIADGFRWLVDTIVVHYSELHARVEKDQERERQKAKRQLDEAKERIRHLRAERERQEELRRIEKEDVEDGGLEEDDEVVVVSARAAQVGNGAPSLSGASDSVDEDNDDEGAPSRRPLSLSEAQELRELGFPSDGSLAALPTDTDEASLTLAALASAAAADEQVTISRRSSAGGGGSGGSSRRHSAFLRRGSRGSPSLQVHRSDSGRSADNSSHRIIVVSSPSTTTPSSPSRTTVISNLSHTTALSPSSSVSPQDSDPNRDSGFPTTPATATPHAVQNGLVRLRLGSSEEESADRPAGDAVPIDSDDELFNMDQRDLTSRSSSPPRTARSDSSLTAYVRDQLELETTLRRVPKKKSFLKRYHRTAPEEAGDTGLPVT